MGQDVTHEVQFFFTHEKMEQPSNSNVIVLVPKIKEADNMKDFKPLILEILLVQDSNNYKQIHRSNSSQNCF